LQFQVIGKDGTDDDALNRRLAVREQHIAMGDQLRATGNVLFGVAHLDADGKMTGSTYIVDFPSRQELDAWLAVEPYVTGDVWRTIEVTPCRVGPSFVDMIAAHAAAGSEIQSSRR
jgi:uncharacterized protein YciI